MTQLLLDYGADINLIPIEVGCCMSTRWPRKVFVSSKFIDTFSSEWSQSVNGNVAFEHTYSSSFCWIGSRELELQMEIRCLLNFSSRSTSTNCIYQELYYLFALVNDVGLMFSILPLNATCSCCQVPIWRFHADEMLKWSLSGQGT